MNTLQQHALISFGPFQVDIDSGELRKFGVKTKLQSQPFRALVILLAKPGEVVTREELQHEIWGATTSVDFERGLASAINKLREALGESAESPRYVETLAKRGYRFIAPVTTEFTSGISLEASSSRIEDLKPAMGQEQSANFTLSESLKTEAVSLSRAAPVASLSSRWGMAFACLIVVFSALAACYFLAFRSLDANHASRPPRIWQVTEANEIFAGLPNFESLPVLVTDGPRIYTSSLSGGRTQLSSIELSEGRMQPVSAPDELSPAIIADLSTDGSKLLLRSGRSRESEQPLWIVPTSGSTALRVGDVLAHDATWMPGGKGILYATGNELRIVQLDTGEAKLFTSLSGRAFWPRWSPDGNFLRFTLVDPITHASHLWEFGAKTKLLRQLQLAGTDGMALCCGSWMMDSKTYVFEASSPQESNIWAVVPGRHPIITELTNGPLRYLSPLPSHDDQTVYFIGLEQPAGTRLYDPKVHSFIPAPAHLANAQRITYSRDGAWVAWTDADSRLFRSRSADGSNRLQLTGSDLEVFLAEWSPDGTHLVVMARKAGETWKLYLVSAAGGGVRILLSDTRNLADPSWSPDEHRVVFGREADSMGKENGPRDIEFLDIESRRMQKLEGSENLFSPRWSPDGRWIAALALDQTHIAIYDVQRQTWKTLYSGSAADPVWSADSKFLYFHAFAEPGSPIMHLSLDGNSESITDLTKLGLPAGENFFFSGVTPTGSPFIKPSIGSGNLYSVSIPH
jgi:Tol biopolymer transport system component/DNA-binding winged helix-turn-helix (wHTH) protein